MKQIKQVISKQDILNKYDQIELFSTFLNIDRSIIEYAIETNTKIHSPLRTDNSPSLGFRFNNKGKLRMKDFAGYFWGDIFDLVAYVSELDITTRVGFKQILNTIIEVCNNPTSPSVIKQLEYIKRKRKIITISHRHWNSNDFTYWSKIKADFNYLYAHNVYPIQNYWIDYNSQPEPKYYYNSNDPAYAYYLGSDKSGIELYQIYFPFRSRRSPMPRFITNCSILMGYLTLRESDTIVITKSYKDVIALHRVADYIEQGNASFSPTGLKRLYTSIAVPSEQYNYSGKIHNNFTVRYKNRYLLYDFDSTGISNANYIRKLYNINPIFFTNGKYGTDNYVAKDFSDYLDISGLDKTAELVLKVLKK